MTHDEAMTLRLGERVGVRAARPRRDDWEI